MGEILMQLRKILGLALCLLLIVLSGMSQEHSNAGRVRDLAAEVALAITNNNAFDGVSSVQLKVEGNELISVVENAFLVALRSKGIQVNLAPEKNTHSHDLRLLILQQTVSYSNLPNGQFLRHSTLSLEARLDSPTNREVLLLETNEKSQTDTVYSKENWPFSLTDPVIELGEKSIFTKLISPLIVITGAALIIYLLFTIRS